MVVFKILYTKRALKEMPKVKEGGFDKKVKELIEIVQVNPFQNPPSYEKLCGFQNTYSRRINIQHRFVYMVVKDPCISKDYEGIVKIISLWNHYGILH